MLSGKTKDAVAQLKALAAGYQAVIDLAEGVDSLVAVQGHLAELDKTKEAKLKEVADVESVLVTRKAALGLIENRIVELENKAQTVIEAAQKKADEIERTGVFDAKALTDKARLDAADIIQAAKIDAANNVKKSALAKAAVAEWDNSIAEKKAEYELFQSKIDEAKASFKAVLGE